MFEYEPGYSLKKSGMEKFEKSDYEGAIDNLTSYINNFNHCNKVALMNRGIMYMKKGRL